MTILPSKSSPLFFSSLTSSRKPSKLHLPSSSSPSSWFAFIDSHPTPLLLGHFGSIYLSSCTGAGGLGEWAPVPCFPFIPPTQPRWRRSREERWWKDRLFLSYLSGIILSLLPMIALWRGRAMPPCDTHWLIQDEGMRDRGRRRRGAAKSCLAHLPYQELYNSPLL